MGNVVVVDHGAGNLGSVVRAFRRRGAPVTLTRDPEEVRSGDDLVLPGDGRFGEAMRGLRERGLEAPLRDALERGARLLGICVGLQILLDASDEDPDVAGLALLPGRVRRFPSGVRAPHIGWNQLEAMRPHPLFAGVPEGSWVYFLHTYYADLEDDRDGVAQTEYAGRFVSAVARGRIAGIQFHPEKSGRVGERILANFLASR